MDLPDYLAGAREMSDRLTAYGVDSKQVIDLKNQATEVIAGNEAREALRNLIKADGDTRGMPHDAQVEQMILAMVDEGLVTANPDGTITLSGTREQLLKHGLDPDAMEVVDVPDLLDERLDAAFTSCWDPTNPGNILCFPQEVWEQVQESGEKYSPLTAAEVRQIHRDNPDGTVNVSMVMAYEKDKPLEPFVVSNVSDLARQLAEVDDEIATLEAQQAINRKDVEDLEWLKTEYGQLLGTRPGQQFVGVNIIGLRRRDKRPSTPLVLSKTFGSLK